MRKIIASLGLFLLIISAFCTTVYAASVPPLTLPGNDSDSADYTTPEGCIHYVIPDSNTEGAHTVTFNAAGAVDPSGPYIFTVVVGTEVGENYTKVLIWSSNFPIFEVIVQGGDAFNLYHYSTSIRSDTDLVAPNTPSGEPTDVNHVSITICPEDFPPAPLIPVAYFNTLNSLFHFSYLGFFIIFTILIIVFFLLGLLFCKVTTCCKKRIELGKSSDNINLNINPDVTRNKNENHITNDYYNDCDCDDCKEHPDCYDYDCYKDDHNICEEYTPEKHFKQHGCDDYPPLNPPNDTFNH